jgi:hypothetical protein
MEKHSYRVTVQFAGISGGFTRDYFSTLVDDMPKACREAETSTGGHALRAERLLYVSESLQGKTRDPRDGFI